jgi:hypothetical protein
LRRSDHAPPPEETNQQSFANTSSAPGYCLHLPGGALKFDGFTTVITRPAAAAPALRNGFSVEAWIALGAYPWNWCPLVSQAEDGVSGYYIGIDSQGYFGLRCAVAGKWVQVKSDKSSGFRIGLGLRRWHHIAAVYDPKHWINLYQDGEVAGKLSVSGAVGFRPGSGMEVFNVEVRPEYSHFPWWNHWPVAQVVTDGRHAQAADRMASSSLVWGDPRDDAALYGMTDQPAPSLVPRARSWISPPACAEVADGFTSARYDFRERAFQVTCTKPGSTFRCRLEASTKSPLVNPAFVIAAWGEGGASLSLDGKPVPRGKTFRYGHRHTLEGSDLVVWIKKTATRPTMLTLAPAP